MSHTVDMNRCVCGWRETRDGDGFNARRKKCPRCGRSVTDTEVIRWFTGAGDECGDTDEVTGDE